MKKIRTPATEKDYLEFKKRRNELLNELAKDYKQIKPEASDNEARSVAWGNVYYYLWAEFGCCYYSCKQFRFQAWNTQGETCELIELAKEITEKEVLKAP